MESTRNLANAPSDDQFDAEDADGTLSNRKLPKYVHVKKAKGRTYYYFDTGRRKDGKRILSRLPRHGTKSFTRELERAQLARWRRETASIPTMAIKPLKVEEFDPKLLIGPSIGDDLYFIRAGDAVKIGRAVDVWTRMANMQVNNHLELDCICRLRGRGHEERAWHSFFRTHHIRGEWFQWTPAMAEAVRLARAGEEWWK
jgi:hypothetical protein